jgi:hypothetical protein
MNIEEVTSLDPRLSVEEKIDGIKIIFRQSPYNTEKKHIILEVENKFIGSGRWVRDSLIKMDTQRHDIFGRTARNNMAIRNRREDNRIHREIAEMVTGGGDTFIN